MLLPMKAISFLFHSAYEGISFSIFSWASFSFSNNLANLSSSSLLLVISLDLRANIWTSKSSLGNLFCLNSLNMERFALPKIVRRSSGGLVTELSSSSLSTWTNNVHQSLKCRQKIMSHEEHLTSPLEVTFSFTTRKPPGLRP